MNNYNELRNKPTINGKELIGDVNVSSLPKTTNSDVGKTLIVNGANEWVLGYPINIDMSTIEEIAGFFTDTTGGAIVKTPIFKKTFKFSALTQSIDITDLNVANVIKFEGIVKALENNTYTNIDYYTDNHYHIMAYFDEGYIKFVKGDSTAEEYDKGLITIYYTKSNVL